MKVEGGTAYCIDINTDFKNGYKTGVDASSRMSANQISDVTLGQRRTKFSLVRKPLSKKIKGRYEYTAGTAEKNKS